MKDNKLYKLRYPIGEFTPPETITNNDIERWIEDIENFPKRIEEITKDLNDDLLSYRYRPNGWTIKQVVHHCADSHINSIIRFKLALTEDTPRIRPYFEDRWAKLNDYHEPIDTAISILKGVHNKLGILLRNFTDKDFQRTFVHPEHGKIFTLKATIGVYAWHSNHHLAHIKQALEHEGKF